MRFIIIASYPKSLLLFRKELMLAVKQQDFKVIAVAPFANDSDTVQQLTDLGIECVSVDMQSTGLSISADWKLYQQLRQIMKKYCPDIVFAYTIKPVIYGSLAASKEKVPRIFSMITGLGAMFSSSGLKISMLRQGVKYLYKQALRSNCKVIFQNPDDRNLFVRQGLVKQKQTVLVNGSGVNSDYFKPNMQPSSSDVFVFTMIARLIADKGVFEYVKAAALLRKKYTHVVCQLIGPLYKSPSAIQPETVKKWQKEAHIKYIGEVSDVRQELIGTNVYVLPSFYGEGVPRSILEAMSMAKPIITTDSPGCRQTVIPGKNGFLVKPKDAESLYQAMKHCVEHPEELVMMGQKSRERVLKDFDVHKVNQDMLSILLGEK